MDEKKFARPYLKEEAEAGHRWLIPVILTTWEPEIEIERPPWANSSKDPHLKNNQSKMDWRCGSRAKS
jgi:hypothetical protein